MTELMCLAVAIFFEARGEPHTGQEMVAEVVMNRVEHHKFPDTVCDVVYEDRQFSFTHDGIPDSLDAYELPEDRRMADKAIVMAHEFLNGYRFGATSTHFHADYVEPFWTNHYEFDGLVGSHLFYTCYDLC